MDLKPSKQFLEYADAVRKGKNAEASTLASDHAGQRLHLILSSSDGRYLDHKVLRRWGYTRSIRKWFTCPDIIDAVLKDLGRQPDKPRFEVLDYHNQPFLLNGAKAPPTDATFTNMVDRDNGFLVAWENHGPGYQVGNYTLPIPELKHWSDIAFLAWTDPSADPNGSRGKLKYVIRWAIENGDTIGVIDRLIEEYRKENEIEDENWKPEWPGISFEANSERLQALLGTPNGQGVAWLLIQHKAQLGHKFVHKVTLFFTSKMGDNLFDEMDPSLLFCLDVVRA